jgi:hypothetical protein
MAAAVARGPAGQPDIAYAPDFHKYQARSDRRLQSEQLSSQVPNGFPAELKGNLVWEGESVGETYDWTFVLTEGQLVEIDEALKHFQCTYPSSWSRKCD